MPGHETFISPSARAEAKPIAIYLSADIGQRRPLKINERHALQATRRMASMTGSA